LAAIISSRFDNKSLETFMAAIPQGKAALETLRINEKKWSKELMDAGWVAFPSILLEKQHALGLDPIDVNILLHLATYWWTAENKPHPSKGSIAAAIGVKPRTVQRHIAAMEHAGLILREERRISRQGSKTNLYHFDGLIKEAKPFALEKIEMRDQRRAEDEKRRKKKGRPSLRLVGNSSVDDVT
jgi:DNA-binding transcriptional ArsR family regulator